MVEALANVARERRLRHHVGPVEQEIVVIEDVLHLLRSDIGFEELRQLASPLRAPWVYGGENVIERRPAVDDARVDRNARALRRKSTLRRRQAEIVTREIEQILGIRAIEDAERFVDADARRVLAQHAR